MGERVQPEDEDARPAGDAGGGGDAAAGPRHVPTEIRQAGPRRLAIAWADGARTEYDVRRLRLACRCAVCVDEWSGEARVDPASVPEDVHPLEIQRVGRYAIQIRWSDGHESGIYAFRRLRDLDAAEPG